MQELRGPHEKQNDSNGYETASGTKLRRKPDRAEETLDSGVSAGESKEHGHFRTWWSDYQKKMRSAFQAILLKLQMQGEQ